MKYSEVKRRTGFSTAKRLMKYVIIICNGNLEKLQKRVSDLTWFEEWFLYFEWTYGHTCTRSIDLEREWGLEGNRPTVNAIKDCKLAIEMAALQSWPRFATYEEDAALKKKGKWSQYDGQRVIMWDMTNVLVVKFEAAALQQATFSEYYSENCFKGGVGIQLCEWLIAWDLWGGGVSDTDYNARAGYLAVQQQFQEWDLVFDAEKDDHTILAFLIL